MEPTRSSETSVYNKIKRRHIPEDRILQIISYLTENTLQLQINVVEGIAAVNLSNLLLPSLPPLLPSLPSSDTDNADTNTGITVFPVANIFPWKQDYMVKFHESKTAVAAWNLMMIYKQYYDIYTCY
jgi:hypothetical protein